MNKLQHHTAAQCAALSKGLEPPAVRQLADFFSSELKPLVPGGRFYLAPHHNEFLAVANNCRLAPYSYSLYSGPSPGADPSFAKRFICGGFLHSGTGAVVLPSFKDEKLKKALEDVLPYTQFANWKQFDLKIRDRSCEFFDPKVANAWFPCREIGGPRLANELLSEWLLLSRALGVAGYELRFEGSSFCVLQLDQNGSGSALSDRNHLEHFRRLLELANFIGSAYFGTTAEGGLPLMPGPSLGALVTEVIERAPAGAVLTVGTEGMLRVKTGYVSEGTSCTIEKVRTEHGRVLYNIYRGLPGGRSDVVLNKDGTAIINGEKINLRTLPHWEDAVIGSRVSRLGLLFGRGSGVEGCLPKRIAALSRFPLLIKPDYEAPSGFTVITELPGGDAVRLHSSGGGLREVLREVGIGKSAVAGSGDTVCLVSPGTNELHPSHTFSFILPSSCSHRVPI